MTRSRSAAADDRRRQKPHARESRGQKTQGQEPHGQEPRRHEPPGQEPHRREPRGQDLRAQMMEMGAAARQAARELARVHAESRARALLAAAQALRENVADILAANARDMQAGRRKGLSAALLDRLALDEQRVEATAGGVDSIAGFADPVGGVIAAWERPNGLRIQRVRVPLGVIGIIYESRPNVTADAGALCLKSGNAVILRGGTEAAHSNAAIHACLVEGLKAEGLPAAAVQRVPTQDREAVGILLREMGAYLDVIVPRGGKRLIARVQEDARVPVMGHLEGICHTYVHASADLDKARKVVVNAKMRRTGICGATETLLVDRHAPAGMLDALIDDLIAAGCEVRGDEEARRCDARVKPAAAADWGREFLDAIIAVRVVDDIDAAMAHIRRYGSGHTEAILAEDSAAAERFLGELDSAILLHNASTQYADGGEFGMGAEIGIATGRIHARGPVGAEQLTSYKYVVRGDGQARP